MPKKNLPNYRLHKATKQAFVVLLCHDGVRRYRFLGKHGTPESRSEYDRLIAIYTANGRKMPPPETSAGVLVKELAVKYLQWAEGYYQNSPRESFWHQTNAILNFLVKHYKNKPVNEFTPADLYDIQDRLIKHGYRRQSVNRYTTIIKKAFKMGVSRGWGVQGATVYELQTFENLKKGRSSAKEYQKGKKVPFDVYMKTLPFMNPTIRAMAEVQFRCGMRPQDIRNLRYCDIDFESHKVEGVWLYRPHQHKTDYRDDDWELVKVIDTRAQEILTPYLVDKENAPEAFIFSPAESMHLLNVDRRRNRMTLNKQGLPQRTFYPMFQLESRRGILPLLTHRLRLCNNALFSLGNGNASELPNCTISPWI
jgi:integrase